MVVVVVVVAVIAARHWSTRIVRTSKPLGDPLAGQKLTNHMVAVAVASAAPSRSSCCRRLSRHPRSFCKGLSTRSAPSVLITAAVGTQQRAIRTGLCVCGTSLRVYAARRSTMEVVAWMAPGHVRTGGVRWVWRVD